MTAQMCDIPFTAGKKIIQANDLVSLIKQTLANVTTEKTGSTCY